MGFLSFGRNFRSGKVHDGDIVARHVANTFIQAGATSVSFGFAVAGEENVSASITFRLPFRQA